MKDQPFSNICKQVISNVYPQIESIKSKNRGVIYGILNIILSGDKQQIDYICRYFGVDQFYSLEDEQKFADEFLDDIKNLVFAERLVGIKKLNETVSTASIKLSDFFDEKVNELKGERKMEWIIIVACVMVGAFACLKYLKKTPTENILSTRASLCLTVPASAVYKLKEGDEINKDEISRLIDSASEFLCVETSENIPVEIIDEKRTPNSQLKFYIRINLTNGGNIIGKETQYGMTRELPLNVTGTIIQLGFLKNVSILRSFKRI